MPDSAHISQTYDDQTLQALLDKEAIRDLVRNYSRGVDRQDFKLLRSLYADDAIEDDHGGAYSGSAEGYVDWLESVMGRVVNSSHMIHQHTVVLESATTAQGEVYLSGHSRLEIEGGWEDLTHGMRYLDHYTKRDGKWLFQRRTIIVDWLSAGPTQWDPTRGDTRDAEFGKPGSGDASYRVLRHPFFHRR
jgi:ketosteroid isomerase-like protein